MALMGEKKEIHVLMVAFGAIGHINPMLRLGKRLLSKGLHVTLATTDRFHETILQSTAASSSAHSIGDIRLDFFTDGLSPDFDVKSNMDLYMDTLAKFGPINLSTLIQNHSNGGGVPKFSCIINNPFVPWVVDVAADHKIPCAMLWIQPCTLYAIYYRFYNDLNPFPTSENPNLIVDLPGLPLLHTEDLPSFVLPSNTFSSFPKVLSETLRNMKKLTWVLANSSDELEKDAIDSMNEVYRIRPVGPLVPSSLLGEDEHLDIGVDLYESDDTCIEWLNQQQPSSVIYVSFGSIIDLFGNDMESIATGLQNSKRPFLWVVLKGDEELPLGFSEETKDRGLIVKWSPQIEVLANPSVACFLSHCGWNSLLETVAAGVPVIGFPQWTDQPTNAKLIADVLRVGVRLSRSRDGVLSSDEVERCIEEVMGGPRSGEFKKNAAELKRAVREAVADGGSSDRNIQFLVDEIIGDSCS